MLARIWSSLRHVLTVLSLGCGFFTLFVWSVGQPFYSSDASVMYNTTRAIAFDHTLKQPNEPLPQLIPIDEDYAYSKYDVGMPLLAAPIVGYADTVAKEALANRYAVGAIFVMVLPALGMTLTLIMLYLMLLHLAHNVRIALAVVLVAGLGTILWPYGRLFFAEALTAACLMMSVALLTISQRLRITVLLLSGLIFAIGVLTRVHFIIFLPAMVWLVWQRTRSFRAVVLMSLGAVLAMNGWLYLNALRFGNMLQTGYTDESFNMWFGGGIVGLLVSPGKSIFLYSPPLVMSAILWPRFRRQYPQLARFITLMTLSGMLFYGTWWAWHGGWVWGPRFLVPLVPLWMLPWVVLPQLKKWLLAASLIFFVGIGVQIIGVFTDVNVTYQAVFIDGTDPDDESLYAVVHYDIKRSPFVVGFERGLRGKWENQAIYHLQSTDLTADWVYGVPQTIERLLTISVGWLLWMWVQNPSIVKGE